MIELAQLQFGEVDARNEVFQQSRQGSRVFFNSFQVPPGVNLELIEAGARFYVIGQKGAGKTALIWYLKELAERRGNKAEVVLFKSDLTEVERQRISTLGDAIVFSDQGKVESLYDYKQNWLWFIIKTLVRMVDEKDVVEGRDVLHDLKELTGVNVTGRQTVFSGLQFTKIKASIESGLKLGVFKSNLKAEIDAVFAPKSPDIIEVIAICERALSRIKLLSSRKCNLFFDELELFLNKEDQRNRDLFLIRDLLYAVSRVNRGMGHGDPSFVVYASVRSEVLLEVNRVGPETKRDVSDFGVEVAWNVKALSGVHPLLAIVESKINNSELELGVPETEDVWAKYFPRRIFGKSAQNYLMDISMHKPRNLVRRLRLARDAAALSDAFIEEDFDVSSLNFSKDVWAEMEEDLGSTYSPEKISSIKKILSGFRARFSVYDMESRIEHLSRIDDVFKRSIGRHLSHIDILGDLYRIGALGNSYFIWRSGKKLPRDRWVFRGYDEPLFDQDFVIHESLLKNFQLSR